MKAPPVEEPPPPPLLVPARRELARFGQVWTGLGAALLLVGIASGSTAELDIGELVLIAALVGLSLGAVLGALLLARRTGPEILYYRILDRASPPAPSVPREPAGATTRRIVPPAIVVVIGLLVAGFIGSGVMLVLGGQPRAQIRDDLAGGALLASSVWTLACGAAGLRIAFYFSRWERRRDAVALCRPLKAGTMRPVYWVEYEAGPPAWQRR